MPYALCDLIYPPDLFLEMTLLCKFGTGGLHLLPMDLTTLRAAEFDILLVDGLGLDLLKSEVVDGTAGALGTSPFNLIAFFFIHLCLLVLLGTVGADTMTSDGVYHHELCPRNSCSSGSPVCSIRSTSTAQFYCSISIARSAGPSASHLGAI